MKQLYLLLSLLLLCTTVLRVDASIILSGPVLVPGIQLRSNLQPSDYFTAGSVAAGAASFMCPTNPAQNDSSGVASADTGAFYVNKNFSISQFNGGFQVIVNFNQSGPYGGISAPGFPGRGFAFVIHQSGNVVVPPDGQTAENLGFRNLTNVAGFGLKWPFSTGSPSFNWFPSYSVNEPAVSNQTNIASINETIRVLTIQYETYNVPTPMVSAFMDGNLLFHSEINLPNYIGNSSEAANFGIAGSIAQGFRHGQMFSSGPIPVSNSLMDIRLFSGLSRLSVSCPRLLNLFAKNVVVPSVGGRGSVSSGWVAEHYTSITSDWVPDDVVYFQGNDSIPNPYCVIELRNNSIPINIVGLMRCSDTLVTGMNLNSTDDSLITPAGVFGTNAYANFNGYPHVGGISSWAERVWAPSASSPSAYCRVRVPRYCVPTDLRYCWNSESCVNGLCNCVPPFGGVNCTGYVTPTISSASPLALTMNSGAWITVTGTNFFNTGTPSCFFTGTTTGNTYSMSSGVVVMNDTTLQCQLPNFSGSVSELFTLQVDNGFMGSTKSNGFNISVFVAPIPTAVYPSNSVVDKAVNLTIQGNFPLLANMAYSIRINSTVAAPCTRVNSTTLSCQYTSSSPGVYPVEVSGNGMQYYSINTTTFTWFVTNSPYCRNYQAGSSRPNEFPFVPSTDIQRGGNITFIKNVAYFANVNTSFSGNMSNYGLSLVDSDYCCQATGSNQATYCGSRFSITNTTAIIDVTFPKDARINEVITSWNNPCQNLVGAYNLHYRKSSTVPFTYIKTTTTNNATCVTVSGDNRPVGICVDYFSSSATSAGLIDTRYLRITFDVSTDNLPPTSTGAWLYEISVIGAFLDEAWAIKSSSAFWNSFAKFTSNDTITLSQSFGLSIVSINNSVASNANGLPVQIALFDSYGTDVSSKYLSVPGGTNQTFSGTIFNGVQLVNSTPIGNYSLRFTSTGLQSSQIPFAVTAGPPYRIRTNNSTLTVTADAMVPVTSVTICVEDKQGNVVFPDPSIEVLVSLSVLNNTLTFSGSTYLTVTGGCNSFPFNLSTPYAMTHLVMFTATYQNVSSSMPSVTLGGSNISLTVQVGSGSKMIFTGNNHLYDAPAEPDANDPPVVTITDGAGNALSGTSRGDLYNSYSATLTFSPTTARNLSGIVATFNNGVAKWPNLAFEGVPGTVYTVTATIDSGIFPPTNFPITVKNCSDIQQDTFLDGWSCKCKPGYTDVAGECTPCPAGTYSTGLGSTECTDCPPDQDTYGQTGQTTCVCDEDHMAAKGGECKDCPTGAICGNNTVQGNQEGYWNNGNGIFYPCYVGDESNPTDENLQSSYEACPSERSHNKTNCGEGYAGLACLECADGYGKQGDYCRACPNATINWAVIIFALLVILCMLVFLVIQGRTPKNKESVSGKILLNHIQMMSLLASLGAIWTDPFFTFLKIGGVSTFADTQLVSVDCTVGTSFYSEFIFFMLIPIFTVVISSIVYVIVYIIRAFIMPCIEEEEVKRSSVRTSVLSDWVLCIAVVTFIFYPAICIKALEIFDCNIDIDDKTYLTVAPGEECLTARWRGFVVWAVIMLAVFCVGVPLFVLFMLYKYRMHPNVHAQTILRFFYDGFKSDRYYWEVVILARKFLIVLFIIVFRFRPIYQIFGMLFVIQAALLIHIMFHPYTSGRQYKLELMSLLSILVTLFISLYLADKTDRTVLAAGLSAAVMCMHLFVVASFAFFIGRGLLRRMLAEGWLVIVQYWNRFAPKRFQKKEPQFDQVTEMFQQLGNATDYERDQLYAGLENWWKHAPNYKRRRFVSTLEGLSEGTQFARTLKGKKRDRNNNNNNNNNTPNDESDPASDNEPEANVEMQQLP